jgi:hypothetical protein
MSLIGVWRERKAERRGPTKPPRLWKLLVTLALVVFLIYRLSQLLQ